MNTFQLKSPVSAEVYRSVMQRRSQQGEGFVMKACVVTAFMFVGLVVFGIL